MILHHFGQHGLCGSQKVGERAKILIKSGLVNPICNQIMWNSGKIKIQS